MSENWLIEDKLCSFDEKVRIELGPQIIELECTDENLSDNVTVPHYAIGRRDAYGRIIRPGEATHKVDASLGVIHKHEIMACVDWRAKHVPHVWKVYAWEATPDEDKVYREEPKGSGIKVCINPGRFIKVDEVEDKEDALARAKEIFGGMG